MAILVMIFTIAMVIAAIWLVIDYIFDGFALMEMSKRKGYPQPGTAWIPIYQKYILGKLGGNISLGITAVVADSVMLAACLASLIFGEDVMSILLVLVAIAKTVSFVVSAILAYHIYTQTKKQYAVVFTVVDVLLGGKLRPIFLFAIRKDIGKVQEKETIIQE